MIMLWKCISITAHVGITYMVICILTKDELEGEKDRAMCPGCSSIIKMIDDKGQFIYGESISAPSMLKA